MDLFPDSYELFIIFVLGLIIGSFLDVFVSRFHTGKSINGRSRCMSCGHALSWYELFPLVSYLVLRGRCLNCGGQIPVRLFLMELCTAFAFVYVYLASLSLLELFFGIVLVSALIVVAAYDAHHMVIPHAFVALLGVLSILSVALELGSVWSLTVVLMHLLSAAGASLFFAALWFVSKGRWIGLGDAKLAFPLAFMLLPFESFSMVVLSFWIGAGASIAILLSQRIWVSGKHHLPITQVPLTMKSEVPFAPFMILAFMLVYFQHIDVLSLLSGAL